METRGEPGTYVELWPEIAERLDAALRRRGVPGCLRDDLIQETAARLWERWPILDTGSDVFPLAFTIARNLATDKARDRARCEPREVLGNAAWEDPLEVAAARIELRSVMRALMSLTPRYRDLLLAEAGWAGHPSDETGSVATNMARMRARRRLRALVGRAGAMISWPFSRLRDRASGWNASARVQAGQSLSVYALQVAVACFLTIVGAGVAETIPEGGTSPESLDHTVLAKDGESPASRTGLARSGKTSPEMRRADRSNGNGDHPTTAPSGLALHGLPGGSEGEENGSFGLGGYDLGGEGDLGARDHEVEWRHRHRYRSPRCVRSLAEDEVSTDCSGGRAPSGSVELEHGDKETHVDYGDRP